MKCKTAFDKSLDVGLDTGPGLTEQHHVESADINYIVARYAQTGILPSNAEGVYGDFADADDYLTSQIKVKEAEEAFMRLPLKIRTRFDNQPAKLIEFCNKSENLEEAIKLGLANPKPIIPVETTNPKPQQSTTTQSQQQTSS